MDIDEHVIDDLPAYALGILEDEDLLRVESHLGTCETCREDWQSDQQIVDALSLATPVVEPPAALKASILTAAELDSKERRETSAASAEPVRSGRFERWMPVWGVASLALILVLAAANIFLWSQLREVSGALESTFQVVPLNGTVSQPTAEGLMVVGGDGRIGTLIVDRLPILDDAYEYQVWLVENGSRVDGGVFNVTDEGYGIKYIHSERPLLSYEGFGVTIEPVGGSTAPTGEQVLGIDF